jgi:hypothetical protein
MNISDHAIYYIDAHVNGMPSPEKHSIFVGEKGKKTRRKK